MHPFVCFGGKQNGCNSSVFIDKSDGIERWVQLDLKNKNSKFESKLFSKNPDELNYPSRWGKTRYKASKTRLRFWKNVMQSIKTLQ